MTSGFKFNPFTGNFDIVTTSVSIPADSTSTFTAGSVVFADGTNLAQDNANLIWDNTIKTLGVGLSPGSSDFSLTTARDSTNTSGFAGAVYARHNSFNTANSTGLNSAVNYEEHAQVDTSISAGAASGLFFGAYRDTGVSDDGSLGYLVGTFGGVHQTNTGVNAVSDLIAGSLIQLEVTSGAATTVADFYALPNTFTGGTITNIFGIYLNPPDVGVKKNWLSGLTLLGGSSYSTPAAELDVNGDVRIRNLSTGVVHSNGSGDLTSSPVSLASEVTGVLPEANGGTNQSTYATGDILYASASNTLSKRSIGSAGDVLSVSGGVPTWAPGFVSITARASTNAAQIITSAAVVDFEDVTYDTGGRITTGGSWKYTVGAGEAGIYLISSAITGGSTITVAGNNLTLNLYKNGSMVSRLGSWVAQAASTTNPYAGGCDSISLVDGDYISIYSSSSVSGGTTLLNDGQFNYVTIQKVG